MIVMKQYGLGGFSSFLLAFLVYIIVVFLFFFKIYKERELPIKYTDMQDSFIDVQVGISSFDYNQNKENISKDNYVKDKDLQELFRETTNKQMKVQDKFQEQANLNSLFGDIKDFQEEKNNKIQSSYKSKNIESISKANNLVKKLNENLLQTDNNLSISDSTKEQVVGIYDKFLGEVRRNLEQRWRLYNTSGNFEVTINFYIDEDGKFGYTKFSKSYNENFDLKVENFLRNLNGKYIALPPSNKKFDIIMNLSDKINNIGDVE